MTDSTGISVCSVHPAAASRPPLASIETATCSRWAAQHVVEEVDVVQRRCPEHDARRSRVEHRLDGLGRAQPSPDLNRHVHPARDPAHVLEVGRLAVASAVEVDDMQGAGARIHPPARGVHRVRVIDGLLLEVALG